MLLVSNRLWFLENSSDGSGSSIFRFAFTQHVKATEDHF